MTGTVLLAIVHNPKTSSAELFFDFVAGKQVDVTTICKMVPGPHRFLARTQKMAAECRRAINDAVV